MKKFKLMRKKRNLKFKILKKFKNNVNPLIKREAEAETWMRVRVNSRDTTIGRTKKRAQLEVDLLSKVEISIRRVIKRAEKEMLARMTTMTLRVIDEND